MRQIKRIILVTGTPGVGKTTVSSLLASKLNATHIDLTELAKREDLIIGADASRGTLIADTAKVAKRVQGIINASGRDTVIDGHYAVDVIPAENVNFVLVLRRDPDELKKEMENRGFEEEKLQENLAAEILDICLWEAVSACGQCKVCEVDVTGREIEEVVEEAIMVLKGKKKCRTGIVDWLGKLSEERRLRDFFRNL
ncbi:MAG: adenylate kinase family protein [Candidatus Bathyarchaeota archaeon]|nr:MAG: adenylate kinase family protein [Candidatus Bathyarchaeota archaeon]